jgi:hypothetical protein
MLRLHKSLSPAIIGTTLLLFVASDKCAYAYIDPGTGSYVIQVLAASILAAAFVIKSTWRSIRDAIARMCKRRSDG